MTYRARGHYRNQALELDEPLDLPEGAEVMVEILSDETDLREDWINLGLARLEAEWDNPDDAIYDDWKALYGL